MTASFSPEQVAYLTGERRLGRLASVQPGGLPHLVPLGWSHNAALGTIDISGRNFAATVKVHPEPAGTNVSVTVPMTPKGPTAAKTHRRPLPLLHFAESPVNRGIEHWSTAATRSGPTPRTNPRNIRASQA